MIEDLLQEIVALEKEQEAKVRQSVQDGKDIVIKAKERAAKISEEADDKIKDLSIKNTQKANADADKICAKIIKDAEAEAEKILSEADKKSDKIIADIIGRLEVRYA